MEEASFIFSSNKLELKSEGKDFFVEGYISTSDVDLVNDIVTKNCLLDMAEQMKTRTIKFDVEHEAFRGKSNKDKECNKTLVPVAKVEDFLMDKKGLKVRAMLNRHNQRFDEVKGSIEDGFLDAFSIAYIPTKSVSEIREGKNVRLLDGLELLNVAFTGNPVNTEAKMTNVFAKSLEVLEGKKKGPGGNIPNRTGPHGVGAGPGEGRADGSGMDEDEDEDEKKKKKETKYNHGNDTTKLQEVKYNMEEKEKIETQEEESEEKETKDEEAVAEESKEEVATEEAPKEPETTEAVEENAEVKALTSKVESLTSELAEVKAMLKKPMYKSKVEQKDESKNFEKKSQTPLERIA